MSQVRPRMLMFIIVTAALFGLAGGIFGSILTGGGTAQLLSSEVAASAAQGGHSGTSGGGGPNPVIHVARKVLPSVVSIDVKTSTAEVTGSGFVLDRSGHIVTNNHVIEPAVGGGAITVTFSTGSSLAATIIGRSPSYDIAVLHVAPFSALVPATIGHSAHLQVGQTVVAVGSPLGLNSTVTSGIISATDRPVHAGGEGESSYISALQTDAAINPGNSGGPLANLRGSVVGVNSAIATLGTTKNHQTGSIGVGFAIPIDQVTRTVKQIIRTGHAVFPVIGAKVDVAPSTDGALVLSVDGSSPAADAGIRPGDLIEEVDSTPISDGVQLIVTLRTYRPGDTVMVSVRRDSDISTFAVTLVGKVG